MSFRERYFEAPAFDSEENKENKEGLVNALARAHDRNTNGRTRWFVKGSKQTSHDWQEGKAFASEAQHG
jgi:hypothetical protein